MSTSPVERPTALLIIDVQEGPVVQMGFSSAYLDNVHEAIQTARLASIQIIFVRLAYRTGAPEMSPNNRMLYQFAKSGMMNDAAGASQIHAKIAPQSDDIVLTKTRVSAFTNSELDMILRTHRIEDLILCGNATRMGLLATFFSAADKDYRLTVLSDCCADMEEDVHNFLMEKIFPLQADVIFLEDWKEQLLQPA